MTNKILVVVVVPMIEEEYNIYIPVSKSIKVATDLIVKAINELSLGHYPLKKDSVLMSSTGTIFTKGSVKENNIKNGDKIILI